MGDKMNIHMNKLMKKFSLVILCIVLPSLLSGCLYPAEQRKENQVPYKDQIMMVQTAVNQYKSDQNGLLPIKTTEAGTPVYQKYLIDFKKISPKYMAEPPGNAYESGGVFQYTLVDVESNPTVKLFDMRIANTLQDLNIRLMVYRQSKGYPPFKERLSNDVYTLDFKKLGVKEIPTVLSPFSQKELGFVIDSNGELFIDYTPDLITALENNKHNFKPGDDIRQILVENSFFVPAYSLPYTISEDGKMPKFMTK